MLWQRVRGRALGARIRRQHPIGPYIVDFAVVSVGLVIELDGQVHYAADIDSGRDAWLRERGMRVLHVENRVVLEQLGDVVDEIVRLIEDPSAEPTRDFE